MILKYHFLITGKELKFLLDLPLIISLFQVKELVLPVKQLKL